MAAYPFWRVVADVTGRLLRLQASASAREVQRRVRELYGERETVSRSARYVLRAFADWGVLVETDTKGRYVGPNPTKIDDPPVATWLLEATMFAGETSSTDFGTHANSPALFPFQLTRNSARTRSCLRLAQEVWVKFTAPVILAWAAKLP